jgi:cell wall-associated NlpC family hydrolase
MQSPVNRRPSIPYLGDLIGIPFEFLGRAEGGKASSLDCMGLVLEVYRRAGLEKADPFADGADPKVAEMEWAPCDLSPERWPPLAVLQLTAPDAPEGAVADHLAVYLGAGLVMHATEDKGVVVEAVAALEGRILSVVVGAECTTQW